MEQKLFNLLGMGLPDQPLVYLHEEFKKQNEGRLPNNWVWFSKKDLEAILKSVQDLTDNDGVRLYYGIYNRKVCEYLDKVVMGGDFTQHEGHNTIFALPTYGGHIDNIRPEDLTKYQQAYRDDEDIPLPAFTGGYDVGTICPPYPPGHTDCGRSGSRL